MSAISEFFFASHPSVVRLQLIEIFHPNFSAPLRFVRNASAGLTVLHEDDSGPFNYSYLPMQIKTLGTTSSLDQSLEVTLGDLGEILPTQLALIAEANGFQTKPTLVYREYRSDSVDLNSFGPPNWNFNGFSHHISMGDVSTPINGTSAWSMSAFYNGPPIVGTITSGAIISKQAAADARGWRWVAHSTKLDSTAVGEDFIIVGDEAQEIQVGCTPFPPLDNVEHHAVITYDGSGLAAGFQLYIDGEPRSMGNQQNNLSGTSDNTEPLLIGRRGSELHWEGTLRHVAIWDKELSTDEVQEIYNSGNPPDLLLSSISDNLSSWWKIDDTDSDAPGGVIDHGPAGLHGTAQNGLGSESQSGRVLINPIFGPFELEINGLAFNKTGCTFTAKPKQFNRTRTGEIYDIGRFPMLLGFV